MPVELTCVVCGNPFKVRPSRVKNNAKYCNYQCHQIGEGRKGGQSRGEQMKHQSRGVAYTKTSGRHTHRVIAEQKLGRQLRNGEVVHHKDGNILNNHPDNLEILASQAVHVSLHIKDMLNKRKGKHGY